MDGEGTGGEIGSIRVCVEISEGAENRTREREEPSPFHHSAVPPIPEALRQITTH